MILHFLHMNVVFIIGNYQYFYSGVIGLTPKNFRTTHLSSTRLLAAWDKPRDLDDSIKHIYRLIWTSPDGVNNHLDSSSFDALIDQKLYGGVSYTLKLCLMFLSADKSEIKDCVYSTVDMPESAPIKGPVLKKPRQIREQVR